MSSPSYAEHIDKKNLELYLKARLPAETIAAIDAHLVNCKTCVDNLAEQDKFLWCLAELSSDQIPAEGERRRFPRVTTDEPASVRVLILPSSEAWDVRIVDVSKAGLGAVTPKPLAPGSLIRVNMQFSVACGDVRHCRPTEDGFHAGVRLHDYFLAGPQ